jgi:hypothetical protein
MPIAYRGCISFGDYEMDERFIIGKAVNDAAEHYELADAALVWLTPSALEVWNSTASVRRQGEWNRFHPHSVPLRDGRVFDTLVMSPFGDYVTAADRNSWCASEVVVQQELAERDASAKGECRRVLEGERQCV